MPLVRFSHPSLYMLVQCGALGSPPSTVAPCFHARRVYSGYQPSPERTVRFISSGFDASSEFLRSNSRPDPFGTRLPARVSSLFVTSPGASTLCEGSQVLAMFRPQVLATSRRLSPRSSLRACFIPQPPPGIAHSFRVSSLRAATTSSSEGVAPLPFAHHPLARQCRNTVGTPTGGGAGFEAFIRAGAHVPRGW